MKQMVLTKRRPSREVLADVDMDTEIRPLVERLNHIPGIRTWMSCFGHTDAEGRSGYTAQQSYVRLSLMSQKKALSFFSFLLSKTYCGMGKLFFVLEKERHCVEISLQKSVFPNLGKYYYSLDITVVSDRFQRELKLRAIDFILSTIDEFFSIPGQNSVLVDSHSN